MQWKTVDDLNLSSQIMYQHLTVPREDDRINDYASDYVDVRDVADAFVAALKIEAAGNERFILDAGMNRSLFSIKVLSLSNSILTILLVGAYTFQNLCRYLRSAASLLR